VIGRTIVTPKSPAVVVDASTVTDSTERTP
jgi:hypothetical protein